MSTIAENAMSFQEEQIQAVTKWLDDFRNAEDPRDAIHKLTVLKQYNPQVEQRIHKRLTFEELVKVAYLDGWTTSADLPDDLVRIAYKEVKHLTDGISLQGLYTNQEFSFGKGDYEFREIVKHVTRGLKSAFEYRWRMTKLDPEIHDDELPTGTYYIGDLCYVLSDEDWEQLHSLMFPGGHECITGKHTLSDGRQLLIMSTLEGDGVYFDTAGRNYSVDSGTIGAMLVDDLSKPEGIDPEHNQVIFQGTHFGAEYRDDQLVFGTVIIEV